MNLLVLFLQCGAFIVIPMTTLGFGIWKISQLDEKYHRLSGASLIGFVFFEGSIIGMLIDPRSNHLTLQELILTSLAVGVVVFLFVLASLPIAISILSYFKK